MPHTVAVVATDGLSPFEFAVACEVFGLDRPELGVEWYRFKVCAGTPSPVRTRTGFSIETRYGLRPVATADTVVVPDWHDHDRPAPKPLLRAIRSAYERGARLLSFCSGAFL